MNENEIGMFQPLMAIMNISNRRLYTAPRRSVMSSVAVSYLLAFIILAALRRLNHNLCDLHHHNNGGAYSQLVAVFI